MQLSQWSLVVEQVAQGLLQVVSVLHVLVTSNLPKMQVSHLVF